MAYETKAREIIDATRAKSKHLACGALSAQPTLVSRARATVFDAELHPACTDRCRVGGDVRLGQPDLEGHRVGIVSVGDLIELDDKGAVGGSANHLGGDRSAGSRVEVGPEGGVAALGAAVGCGGRAAGRHRDAAELRERIGRAVRSGAGSVEVVPAVGAEADGGMGGAIGRHCGGRALEATEGEADGHRGHGIVAKRNRGGAYRARDGLPSEGRLIHVEANL